MPPSSNLGGAVGKEALSASGPTVVQYEISRDAQHADLRHDPDPAREEEEFIVSMHSTWVWRAFSI
jgi:hypothetical protein